MSKIPGDKYKNLKQYSNSNELQCIHCNGNHQSNNMKCLVVKEFRANLTTKHSTDVHNLHNNNNNKFRFNPPDFPILSGTQRTTVYGYKSSNYTDNDDNVLL
ncbi:unnamed protein product [Rotaria sp. Silwood2]|nr:unnamed protein product [Rotaria sp. Silwood2]CAF3114850.1 unnamed protein product [Rotaria sp. Silwood2]CAF3388589.1 unnamed protein product [Rotaria sp. Silwood2]CAF4120217.1 unnamed protein product [Rotaria sp. Silwood2]CAF4357472.1 unnamed protein product [Rotaria sp. Silwood2]